MKQILFLVIISPLSVFTQSDLYHAKPWVPKNISPSVAEFIAMPAPQVRRRNRPALAPVYSAQEKPPRYAETSDYFRHINDMHTSASHGKPINVVRPPVTSRNYATQLSPPRPYLPPPRLNQHANPSIYHGMMARSDTLENTIEEMPVEASTLVNFGDWAAQWDEQEEAWYFYNYLTEESTWEKPDELSDLRFENPFSSKDESQGQIPSPLSDELKSVEDPKLDHLELPPQPPPYGVHLDSLIDEEGNYNFGPFHSDNSDGYKTVDANQQSEADDKILTGPVSNILDMIGLNNLKKNRGITSFLGIKLEEGGSLREAMSKNLSENSLYKNVAKDFVETFLFKAVGWAVISMLIYGNNILSARRKRRSSGDLDNSGNFFLSNMQHQLERSLLNDVSRIIEKIEM